jgi:nucleotide-binding universal stress UspA family protein
MERKGAVMREAKRILVGVDGSEASKRALRWALDEAKVRGSEVIAMHAWSFPPVVDVPFDTGADIDWESQSQRCLDEAVDAVVQHDDIAVQKRLIAGGAAHNLVRLSETADLVVVGSRGHGGFAGLLLGSVSQQCAHHAACPVVIVPAA